MIEKTKRIYESIAELQAARANGELKIGDYFLTKDLDGEALFEIADIRKKKVIFCRKHLLEEKREMGYEGELLTWLEETYGESLPEEVQELMIPRRGNSVFLPREVEVFGEHKYSEENEKGRQWELFKNVKKRIRCHSKNDERSSVWWLSSPNVSAAAGFCYVYASGAAGSDYASASYGVLPCFQLAL